MNKSIKKLIILLITVGVLLSCLVFTASSAGSSISFSSSNPKVNDSVTVTVTVNAGEAMYGTKLYVIYNAEVLRFESGESSNEEGGAGKITVVGTPGGASKQSYSIKFTAIAAGSSTIQVVDGMYATDIEKPLSGASATMTVADAAKSDNANLKSLSLSKGTLSPKFSASNTSYTATVANSVTEVKVYATAQDSGANVSVSGESALKVGSNTRTVTVTAPSGAQKVYTITITRSEEETVSEPDVPEVNPFETTVDGATYTVLSDISGITLPAGFTAATAEYNGTEVAAAKDSDGNYILYYLKAADSEAVEPYILNGDTFERLQYAAIGDKIYIFSEIPADLTAPEGYYETAVKIGDFSLKAFVANNTEFTDFYYVYCFYDNAYRMYRYDSRENVLQRAPEFKLVPLKEKIPDDANLATRFASLTANAKTVVIGLLLAAVAAIALIVLLIVKLVNDRKTLSADDYDSDVLFQPDFEEVTVDDGGESEEKNEPDSEKELQVKEDNEN